MAAIATVIAPVGRSYYSLFGFLAQLVEHRPYKARVGGSIPSAPTKVWSGSSAG